MRFRTSFVFVAVTAVLSTVLVGPSAHAGTFPAWGTVPSPNRGQLANAQLGVSVVAPNDAWAVGEYNPGLPPTVTGRRTLTEHWDGAKWRIVRSPNASFAGVDATFLKGVDAVAANDVWAVGFGEDFGSLRSATLTLHWDGTSWTKVPSPNPAGHGLPNDLYAVKAISPTQVFAVGDFGFPGDALILQWNGSSWARVANHCGTGLRGIDALSTDDAWAVGSGTTCHFNGRTWSVVPSPKPRPAYGEIAYSLLDVRALAPDDVWAAGTRTIEQGEHLFTLPLVEHWNGITWTATYSVPGQALDGIDALSANDVYAVGTDGAYPMVAHFDGSGWTLVPSPQQGGELQALDTTPGASVLWAVGSTYAGGGKTLVEQAPSATQGTVVGNTTVSGATVTWIGRVNGSTEADVFGNYFAAGLVAGRYTFIASNPGCDPAVAKVMVVAGQTIAQNLDVSCT